jgi:phosphocarrier protein FPr
MTATTDSPAAAPSALILKAPLSGYLMPIEEVPDPVFAQKMVGDGIAIDPVTNAVFAPCDGEIIQMHDAAHAVTIRSPQGLEVLIHIGLDTVMLKGEGFLPHVKTGDRVRTGDLLIEFDPDYVAANAVALLTMIVISNPDQVEKIVYKSGEVKAGKDVILEVMPVGGVAAVATGEFAVITSPSILVPNPTGFHARPAAVLANVARKYQSDIRIEKDGQQANAKSVVGIMNLNIGYSDAITLIAEGPDAEEALTTLVPMIEQGLGEEGALPVAAPASQIVSEDAAPPPRPHSDDPNLLLGVTASAGLAVGNVFQVRHDEIHVEETGDDPNAERRKLDEAIEKSKIELEALQARLHGEADPGKAAIFAAHQELLEDPDLYDVAVSAIAKGKSAAYAWKHSYTFQADQLSQLDNELLAARANDLRDVGRRVLRHITGATVEQMEAPANSILIAEDLTPSDTANLDRSKVLGFATTLGSATSHVAILARSLDIPAVAGIEAKALDIPNGTPVILDGNKGTLRMNPSAEEIERIQQMQSVMAERRKIDAEHAHEPAITTDGVRMEVVANIGGVQDAVQAVLSGGEGVGLLRSEFLFLGRTTAPTEDEQTETYSTIAKVLGPDRPLIIRTLDVGGDKPLPYLPIPGEENPFLGERGVRVGLNRPEILRTQLRAILRAAEFGKVLVMFPMVATMDEWRAAKGMFDEERERLGADPIPVGIMVEIPAAAVMAEQFAREADFFSIGTNDLTQYTLAMDRGHPKLAPQVDGLNPAVLRLIAHTVEGAHKHGKFVGVCGGIASDSQAVPILLGIGVDELSVSVPSIPAIKAQIRNLDMAECQVLAKEALAAETASAVRAMTSNPLDDLSV